MDARQLLIHDLEFIMVASAVQLAKRALLVIMRSLASVYDVTLSCNRDSTDRQIITNFRKLAL